MSSEWVHRSALGCVAFAIAPAIAAAASCPSSEMSITSHPPFTSTAASYDSSVFYGDVSGYRVAYDHAAGTVGIHHCCGLGRTHVTASDRYDVVGVPAGSRVVVVAELSVEGAIIGLGCGGSGCWGTLGFRLASGASAVESYITRNLFAEGREPVEGGLVLPVTIVAGQPVTIERQLWARRAAGGNHGAEGIGRLRFSGLPEGARVVSCQGFGDLSVSTLRRSWGGLKSAYR
jgi:hypothetical protein